MKICIPTISDRGLDDIVGEHFGRVPTYTIIDLDTDQVRIIANTSHHMGGQGDPPEILAKEGVKIMVCRGLGRRAIALFNQLGIDVFIGANGTVREAIQAFNDGILKKAGTTDACEQHAFRDHHHREPHT